MDSLLSGEARQNISRDNAIAEFVQILADPDDSMVLNATRQMSEITRELIKESMADRKYEQAAKNISVMREELIEVEAPDLFNKFIRDLKKDLLNGSLGGDRRELWFTIRKSKLGLIRSEDTVRSEVSEEEANEVCTMCSLPTHNFQLTGWRYSSYARWRWICRLKVKGTERRVKDWHKFMAFLRIVWLESLEPQTADTKRMKISCSHTPLKASIQDWTD